MSVNVKVKVQRYTDVEVEVNVPESQLLTGLNAAIAAALGQSETDNGRSTEHTDSRGGPVSE